MVATQLAVVLTTCAGAAFAGAASDGWINTKGCTGERPSDRPYVKCRGLVCSSGYTWKDLTIGPDDCNFGKCLDNTWYVGEKCAEHSTGACHSGLVCKDLCEDPDNCNPSVCAVGPVASEIPCANAAHARGPAIAWAAGLMFAALALHDPFSLSLN